MKLPVEEMLRHYYDKYKELDQKGGPEEEGDLFEEVLGLEEEILVMYGLPPSHKNTEILWKLTRKKNLTKKYITLTKEYLEAAAKEHLLAPVLTDLEQLTEAKAQNKSFFNILPELGQPTHDYTIFLYEEVLGAASAEEILEEFSVLRRLDCYGDVYTLKHKHPLSFRRTKVYKQLKPYLKFLDYYLDPKRLEALLSFSEKDEARHLNNRTLFDSLHEEELRGDTPQVDLFSFSRPEPVDFKPDYIILTDLIEIEEIIFDEDSAVTVMGKTNHSWFTTDITLGFDFDVLTSVIQAYGRKGQYILNYFNKNRQLNAIDYPAVISLKDKTGSTLILDQHYFKVYKPLTIGPNGKPEVMKEAFYLVDEIIDRDRYDKQQVEHLRSDLGGWFHHMKNHYYCYLSAKLNGMSEEEARRDNGLEDSTRFHVSKCLYLLEKHGGKAEMR